VSLYLLAWPRRRSRLSSAAERPGCRCPEQRRAGARLRAQGPRTRRPRPDGRGPRGLGPARAPRQQPEEDEFVRAHAAAALGAIGTRGDRRARERAHGQELPVRTRAAEGLGFLGRSEPSGAPRVPCRGPPGRRDARRGAAMELIAKKNAGCATRRRSGPTHQLAGVDMAVSRDAPPTEPVGLRGPLRGCRAPRLAQQGGRCILSI